MRDYTTDDDQHAAQWREQWALPADVIYLNHGSFGPSPVAVRRAFGEWQKRLESEPWDFLVRQLGDHLAEARRRVGAFLGADPDDLVFVENATTGMNIAAASTALEPGDEVLLTDHEYGAVVRIWDHACHRAGAKLVVAELPSPMRSPEEVIDAIFARATQRTRVLVFSHVTSPTATILPAEATCRRGRERGLTVCVDGPHAVGMLPVDLARLDCDYYALSAHKWLSAPFGSGALYVSKKAQQRVHPVVRSWGKPARGHAPSWRDEFDWAGTRDSSAFLSIPAAIEFLESAGLDAFRERTHALAGYARRKISEVTGLAPLVPESPEWYSSMTALRLPTVDAASLEDALWQRHRIEVPVVEWNDRQLIRISCHLYTQSWEIDRLAEALGALLA